MTGSPRRIGRYRLEQVIGTGAFAAVHLAMDERLDDKIAVKLLADNHALDPEIRERFITEGRFLRRIDSPHVVRVHDIGETDERQPFLVLEHADRGTLAQRVATLRSEGWRPGPDDVAVVARSLASAVEALHRADLVHRDLSPGNILLRSTVAPQDGRAARVVAADERLVLADLGLTKDLARHSGFTRAAGTEGFRPPEQRGRSGRVDQRADLWALSALIVWLVTDEPPGDQLVAAAVAGAGLPASLGEALARSLADQPEGRHPDATSWHADVEAGLRPRAGGPGPTLPGAPSPTAAVPRPRWRPLASAAAILALGAGLGAGGTAVLDGGSGDGPIVTRVDENRVQVQRDAGEARIALVGPEEVEVGEEAAFETSGENLDRWVWLMPDGQVYDDAPRVRVRTETAGEARVILVGFSTSGARLEVVHDLQVREGGGS